MRRRVDIFDCGWISFEESSFGLLGRLVEEDKICV
jgi:hypothetical protein